MRRKFTGDAEVFIDRSAQERMHGKTREAWGINNRTKRVLSRTSA